MPPRTEKSLLRLNSLTSRMVVFFSLLLAAVLVIVFLLVTRSSYEIARQQNNQELATGERVFRQLLNQNQQQLTLAASILAADFGFRNAVTSNDLDTILSALDNHGRRIQASLMMLASLDGKLIASTLNPIRPVSQAVSVKELIQQAESAGLFTDILRLGNNAYQIVVVPVLAPQPVAWIIVGFVIDNRLAKDLQELTSLQVSFFAHDEDGSWKTLASTQPPEMQEKMLQVVKKQAGSQNTSKPLNIEGYASLITPLSLIQNWKIVALLQRSTEEAMRSFNPLRTTLLFLALVSLGLTIAGCIFIARNITQPVNELSLIAQKIKEGDYSQAAKSVDIKEIGTLAESINLMREAISIRENEIRRLAYEDSLTGLPNRIMFNNELNRMVKIAVEEGRRFSVLILNLNRFKDINDILGHEAGDNVLKYVAKRLPGALRDSDRVACIGGDEFAVMLPMADSDHLDIVLPRLREKLERPFMVSDQVVDITFSIGIAHFPEHGIDASALLRKADIALNSAKRNRNVYEVYDNSQEASRQEHLHLLGELRSAVENDELCIYYQPKVQLSTNRTLAVETLIRWQHPARGFIPPNEFIPFAEHTGAIRLITEWVIDNALKQVRIWKTGDLNISVSINISARDLLNKDLPSQLDTAIRKHGLSPEAICLEITESALMEDPVNSQSTVLNLHKMGLEISIDDYGTGYSSLAYVKNLPVNELKIDRAFIMNMEHRENDMAIVRSTVDLGHSLGMRVVGEGVETEAQYNLLRGLGCDLAQGYFIAKPMPADEFEAWLNSKKFIEKMQTV